LPDTAHTRLQLCGRLAVEIRGRDATPALPGGHGRQLLANLAVHRDRALERDELKDALWPAGPPAAADSTLSALLSRLRRALGPGVLEGRGVVRLVLPGDAWVDVEAAEAAVHRAEAAVARGEWAAGWGPSQVALAIARRGFLPGADAPWVEERRRRLEDVRCSALECYAAVALGVGGSELGTGERAARELVACAPYRERGHALLMGLLAARGNPAEALRVYESLRERLREELGIVPAPGLRGLQAQLLRTGDLAHA
jgi:DNA-binding SARP family transcriptional activator